MLLSGRIVSYRDWEVLFLALKTAFRSCNPGEHWYYTDLTHTERHRELVDTIFGSNISEATADLYALNLRNKK